MVTRIVMMQLTPEAEDRFLNIFNSSKKEIRSQKGCLSLEILQSSNKADSCIWTISLWKSVDDLETYRASSLFQKTWSDVKPLFAAKAQAWTLSSVELLP